MGFDLKSSLICVYIDIYINVGSVGQPLQDVGPGDELLTEITLL